MIWQIETVFDLQLRNICFILYLSLSTKLLQIVDGNGNRQRINERKEILAIVLEKMISVIKLNFFLQLAMFANFLYGSAVCYFLSQLNERVATIKVRRHYMRLCRNRIVVTMKTRNTARLSGENFCNIAKSHLRC